MNKTDKWFTVSAHLTARGDRSKRGLLSEQISIGKKDKPCNLDDLIVGMAFACCEFAHDSNTWTNTEIKAGLSAAILRLSNIHAMVREEE